MKEFCLITNIYKDRDLKVTEEIADYIRKKGGSAVCLTTYGQRGAENDFEETDIPRGVQGIIVLGGDGTMIRVATKVRDTEVPLIGVNLGTLGYLCELESANVFAAIDNLFADAYSVEERMMLTGHTGADSREKTALNDIVLHRTGELSILNLNVYVNGAFLSTYHADGVIVATPTGSTGYNMSAGGPIVDPKAKMILLTPINAHNLNSRSIVLSADDVVEIELAGRWEDSSEQASVSFDGDPFCTIAAGGRFVISRAASITRICKLNRESFLEIMRRKMEQYS